MNSLRIWKILTYQIGIWIILRIVSFKRFTQKEKKTNIYNMLIFIFRPQRLAQGIDAHTSLYILWYRGGHVYTCIVRRQKLRGEPLCIDCGFRRQKLFKRVHVFVQMITYNIFNVFRATDVVNGKEFSLWHAKITKINELIIVSQSINQI